MTKITSLMTLVIAMTFIVLATTSSAYAQVSNFYWSEDDGTGEIFTADSAGQNVAQVTSGGFVRIDDVEIDPLANRLWWNNWGAPVFFGGASEGIYNSNLDGTGQVQLPGLVSSCGGFMSGLNGIVLDPANLRLFFTRGVSYANCNGGEVSTVNMDGTGLTQLDNTPGGDSWHPDGIELSGNTLFWGNPGVLTFLPANGPVNCMATDGTNQQINQIAHTNGHGRSLALDAANGLLFYSSHDPFGRGSGGAIFVTSPCPATAPIQILNDPNTGIPDIELDAANMRIYWTDYANGLIRSASYDLNGNLGPITTELSGLTNPYGLALELQTCEPVEDPDVRTQGFWKRVCRGPHPSGEHENLPDYVDCVSDTATFADVVNVDSLCDRLNPNPNDKCEQAEAQLMALLLNVCSGRIETCNCLDDGTTVGDAIALLDDLLSNPRRTFRDCVLAQAIAADINEGLTLVDCP